MHYIVLDLEWNQPVSQFASSFKRIGDRLAFELIQLGAVKLDEERRLVGSFNRFIRPTYYQRLHPRIRRITGIQTDDLSTAAKFPEVYERFLAWCGEDAVLLTWGSDDVSILAQNIAVFDLSNALPPLYDLQDYFSTHVHPNTERYGLKKAMAHYHIAPSADHPFHSAVDDAYYTALVFQHFVTLDNLLDKQQKPRLKEKEAPQEAESNEKIIHSVKKALTGRFATTPPCPLCGKRTLVKEGYIPGPEENTFLALSDCKTHGLIKCTLLFTAREDNTYKMERMMQVSDEQHPAYVKTKHLQWAAKVKAYQEGAKSKP